LRRSYNLHMTTAGRERWQRRQVRSVTASLLFQGTRTEKSATPLLTTVNTRTPAKRGEGKVHKKLDNIYSYLNIVDRLSGEGERKRKRGEKEDCRGRATRFQPNK